MEVAGNKKDNENELHNGKKVKETCRRNLGWRRDNAFIGGRKSPLMMDNLEIPVVTPIIPNNVVNSGELKWTDNLDFH